jgi:hypothetical protein
MEELENLTGGIDEDGAIEILLQIASFSSLKYYVLSSWCLNDQRHVSSLLIFVGQTQIGGMLKPTHTESNGFNIEE